MTEAKSSKWDSLEEGWKLHLINQDLFDDPMPYYHELRSKAPVYKTPDGFWIVTDFANTQSIIQNDTDDLEAGSPWTRVGVGGALPGGPLLHKYFTEKLNFNVEAHRRVRQLMQKSFRPREVEKLRQSCRDLAENLLDKIDAAGNSTELVSEYTLQIPTRVILTMLGIDLSENARMNSLSDDIVYSFMPEATQNPEWATRIEESLDHQMNFILGLVEERRKNPKDDLMTLLTTVLDEGKISETELVMNVIFLVVAGHETTANSISSGVHLLLSNPDQLELLMSDWDTYISGTIDEILRVSPATRGSAPKWAVRDFEMGGQLIKKGDQVRHSTIAANRDPARFPDPDRFDIIRDSATDNSLLTFGPGSSYFCLGFALARIEMEEALQALLNRHPNLKLDDDVVHYHKNLQIRGPSKLNVSWEN